jgi:hypothetical protein
MGYCSRVLLTVGLKELDCLRHPRKAEAGSCQNPDDPNGPICRYSSVDNRCLTRRSATIIQPRTGVNSSAFSRFHVTPEDLCTERVDNSRVTGLWPIHLSLLSLWRNCSSPREQISYSH